MSLAHYRRKRDFDKTPEPAGEHGGSGAALQFVVQKHAARRLHYDFRLELDGVLKSWAVPKGPSVDPADKRLAVHVEDHPLAYGGFEGIIPEKQYGAGAVVLWDRGTWRPVGDPQEGYRKGSLKFTLEGEKLRGSWALVKMHGRNQGERENWLLIKEKDADAHPGEGTLLVEKRPESVASGRTIEGVAAGEKAVSSPKKTARGAKAAKPKKTPSAPAAPLPERLEPELATLAKAPPKRGQWGYEVKLDGYRVLARIEAGTVRLTTRNGHDWTAKFPRIAQELAQLSLSSAWLDGEACVMDERGVSSFSALQRWLSSGGPPEPTYMLFDVPFLNGVDARGLPFVERKALLSRLLGKRANRSALAFNDHVESAGSDALEKACKLGLEGLIGKRLDSAYESGRSADWIKLKCRARQELVIGGFTSPAGSRTGFGALVVGVREKGALRYAGRVGTGFDEATLEAMMKRLESLETAESPFAALPPGGARGVRWVRPELIAEFTFAEWTADGIVRQGSFVGLREDKPAQEVVRERAVAISGARPHAAKSRDPEVASVRISHPERLVFSEPSLTKLEVVRYYERIAPHMLPFLHDRPVSFLRCPNGVGEKCFFQKHASKGAIPGIEIVMIDDSHGENPYLLANTVQALVGLAQMGAVELHPWGAVASKIERPDTMIFDLDPDTEVAWARVVEAALLMRALLDALGLASFVKTTGGKGLHVVVPLSRRHTWDEVKEFSRRVAVHVAGTLPAQFTANMSKARRDGKIFIDYLRNGRGATAVAPYSLRARPEAPVAMPVSWEEVTPALDPKQYTAIALAGGLKRRADPWAGYEAVRQSITARMTRMLK